MHLVIVTVGTRGDAQPYVAVGKALRRLGHAVTVATHEDHRALVESNGLAFRPILGSFRELLASPAGAPWLASSDSPAEYVRSFRALFLPFLVAWSQEQLEALQDADGALVHWFALPTMQALERRKTPWSPTRRSRAARFHYWACRAFRS